MNKRNWSFIAIIFIVLGFVGMAYQEFEFGDDLPSYNHKWVFDEGEFKSLVADSDYDIDLKFIDSPDGTDYIEMSGNMEQDNIDKLQQVTLSNGTLNLPLEKKFRMSFLSINFQSERQHITVALSKEKSLDSILIDLSANNGGFQDLRSQNVEITASSGNIEVDSIKAEAVKLHASSGNITANQVQGDTDAKVTSGNIKVNTLTGSLAARTTSGDIKVNDLTGPLSTHATSGNITVNKVQGNVDASGSSGNLKFIDFTGSGKFKLTSGNITLMDQRSDSLDISVSSGNVTLSKDPEFQGFYDLKTTSGNISSPESPQITKDIIKIRATSGNIKIKD
ncbi:hypothetical protein EJP82_18980 [Paenibacillus anaericanus]|uniref:DUF4097 domain-containing protein n=1 Tax=Paenibacillus anaericanus TaxID=170367 RepID=A0A433Y5B3_9BACL|nr:DUF4097 family beta strand repeat-containing protein [Paenibacillus anaericanus]RUT43787.1 hypothetical protein EJP82_18980 [Paenibacillus anaericanus]